MANFTVVQSWMVTFCVLLVIGLSLSNGQKTSKNVICYYDYNAERTSGVTSYTTSDIDPSICTHLMYHYTVIRNGTLGAGNMYKNHSKVWEEFQSLRFANPSLKVILGVKDIFYRSPESESYENRQAFIHNVIDFLRTWNFDGIGWGWYDQPITQKIVTFIQEIHASFMAEATYNCGEPLIVMMYVLGWGGISEGVNLQPLGQAVDILHAIPRGRKSKNDHSTSFVSPMYGNEGLWGNVSGSITDYLDAGIPAEKLHMGIRLSSLTYQLVDPKFTGVGAPGRTRGADKGEYTKSIGNLAYYEVCKRLQEEGYTAEFDPEGLVNFAYKGDQWMTYEDPASLELKMDYVYQHNLGGVAVWFLHDDDYTGQFCNQERYPLISTLYKLA